MDPKTQEINGKSSQKGDAWEVPRRWGGSPRLRGPAHPLFDCFYHRFLAFCGSFLLPCVGSKKRLFLGTRLVWKPTNLPYTKLAEFLRNGARRSASFECGGRGFRNLPIPPCRATDQQRAHKSHTSGPRGILIFAKSLVNLDVHRGRWQRPRGLEETRQKPYPNLRHAFLTSSS